MPRPRRVETIAPIAVPEDRAARRFLQIQHLERELHRVDFEIVGLMAHLAALKKERERYLGELLAAARDEGELPLFADL